MNDVPPHSLSIGSVGPGGAVRPRRVGRRRGGDGKPFDIAFVDLDGVLADFHSAAYRAHGQVFDEATYPATVWNTWEVLGLESDAEFWRGIDFNHNFWHTLSPLPWLRRVVALAHELADVVKVATSPSRSPLCFSGKRMWHLQHLGHDVELILCKSKYLLAAPDRVLIDDADHNCEAFYAAGGETILFPRKWNLLHPFWQTPVETAIHYASRLMFDDGPEDPRAAELLGRILDVYDPAEDVRRARERVEGRREIVGPASLGGEPLGDMMGTPPDFR